MAVTPKVLAQTVPSATTLTTHYTVPAATSATLSTIVVCNRGSDDTTFRVSIGVAGEADATKQYIAYDIPILGNTHYPLTIGVTLAATDVLRVYAGNGNLSFTSFGVEVS